MKGGVPKKNGFDDIFWHLQKTPLCVQPGSWNFQNISSSIKNVHWESSHGPWKCLTSFSFSTCSTDSTGIRLSLPSFLGSKLWTKQIHCKNNFKDLPGSRLSLVCIFVLPTKMPVKRHLPPTKQKKNIGCQTWCVKHWGNHLSPVEK